MKSFNNITIYQVIKLSTMLYVKSGCKSSAAAGNCQLSAVGITEIRSLH